MIKKPWFQCSLGTIFLWIYFALSCQLLADVSDFLIVKTPIMHSLQPKTNDMGGDEYVLFTSDWICTYIGHLLYIFHNVNSEPHSNICIWYLILAQLIWFWKWRRFTFTLWFWVTAFLECSCYVQTLYAWMIPGNPVIVCSNWTGYTFIACWIQEVSFLTPWIINSWIELNWQ